MNIENKFNVGDKVFICGNLNRLREYLTIEQLLFNGGLRKTFLEILNNEITESVRMDIIRALKVKETEITDVHVYIKNPDKPKIMYRVEYCVYEYELEENKIYRTKEEAIAIVEEEIKRIFREIREKIDCAEEQLRKLMS